MPLAEADIIFRLLLATGLGAAIGLEREIHFRRAGLRTHSLIALGSCLFILVSIMTFDITEGVDITRVSAGIVTGIGFLGAGMIFKEKVHVAGLTTAAEVWTLAGIGLAVGTGFYLLSIIATVLVLVVLMVGTAAKPTIHEQMIKKDKTKAR